MTKSPGSNLQGALFALLAFAIFATHDVVVKWLGAAYSPIQIVFFATLMSFPIVTLMMIGDRTDGNLRPRLPFWTALRSLTAVITGVSAFYAFATLPLAQTYAILFASPLLITILAIPLLGETVRARRWAAVIVGLIGVLIVLRPGQAAFELGHLAAITAAVTGATGSVALRKIGNAERSAVILLFPMLATLAAMGALLPFVYKPMPIAHFAGSGLIALLAFAAMLCVIAAYRRAEAVVIAPMQYSQILWASLYGYLLFDERPDLATAIGAGIIIASGIYIVRREGSLGASRTRPVLRTGARPETGTTPRANPLAGGGEHPGQSRD